MGELKSRAIYDTLRSRILAGEAEPGRRLVMREIAEEFGASDIPAREALRMLEQDGLVDIVPFQGARVTVLSPTKVREAYFVRGHLEALATELATRRLSREDFDALDDLLDRMEAAGEDATAYAELNRRFHTFIVERAGNSVLEETIVGIWQTQSAFQVVFRLDPSRHTSSNAEHRAIVDAMRRGDSAEAGRLALEHKFATANALSTALEEPEADRTDRSA